MTVLCCSGLVAVVEVTGETYEATATPLEGEERDRLFKLITDLYPFFREHQERVGRTIPVVALAQS